MVQILIIDLPLKIFDNSIVVRRPYEFILRISYYGSHLNYGCRKSTNETMGKVYRINGPFCGNFGYQ